MKRKFIINLLKQLVIPAFGCTEIGSIAYAAGTASKYLKHKLKDMTVYVSGFIYRNVANVGVPKMGKVGVEGIAAGGFLVKQPQKKLLILNAITDKQIKESEEMVKKHLIKTIILKTCDPVYVRVVVKDVKNNVCDVLVERKHDVIRHIKLNNRIMDGNTDLGESKNVSDVKFNVNDISLNDIYEIVRSLEMKDLKFLEKGITMNENIAKAGNQKNYFVIKVKNDWRSIIKTYVFNAVAARMDGCPLPVMSSNDSGDHGLTVNLPQYVYYLQKHTSQLVMLQAIAFANLITWKIKKNIGSLSAYCGSVVAATTATIVGIGYQRNYSVQQLNDLINCCLSSFAGSLCDGAKLSCAWKIDAALTVGFEALDFIENKLRLPNNEGINNRDAFETIKLIGNLSKTIMNSTNSEVIDIINSNR